MTQPMWIQMSSTLPWNWSLSAPTPLPPTLNGCDDEIDRSSGTATLACA